MRDIEELKNKHKGKRCFVIGNDLSLNKIDLTLMKNDVTIGSNLIGRLIKTDYLCVSDANVYRMYKKEIDSYPIAHKIFSGPGSFSGCKNIPENGYFVDVKDENICLLHKSYDGNLKRTYSGRSVIIDLCLPLAFYMGCTEVYLIGCGCSLGNFYHRWTVKKSISFILGALRSLFTLEYRYFLKCVQTNYIPTNPRGWDEINRHYRHVYKPYYEIIKKCFEKDNRVIYNATLGGVLEVFERKDYASLFNKGE